MTTWETLLDFQECDHPPMFLKYQADLEFNVKLHDFFFSIAVKDLISQSM